MWYNAQTAANQPDSASILSFFDCKDMYEKAYAHKPKVREAILAYNDWRKAHKGLIDPQARAKSALLGRLLRAEAGAEIAKFRAGLADAEMFAAQYKAQIQAQKAPSALPAALAA